MFPCSLPLKSPSTLYLPLITDSFSTLWSDSSCVLHAWSKKSSGPVLKEFPVSQETGRQTVIRCGVVSAMAKQREEVSSSCGSGGQTSSELCNMAQLFRWQWEKERKHTCKDMEETYIPQRAFRLWHLPCCILEFCLFTDSSINRCHPPPLPRLNPSMAGIKCHGTQSSNHNNTLNLCHIPMDAINTEETQTELLSNVPKITELNLGIQALVPVFLAITLYNLYRLSV